MAEAAHLTSATTAEKPSIFEVIAQESLMSIVRPAFKHAVRVLAETRPEKFGWLLRYYDEVYIVLDLTLQNYYLRKYCASFAENFYGLKRVPLHENPGRKLPSGVYWKSLLCLVTLPYVKQKLDQKFEELRHEYNTYASHMRMSKLSRLFIMVYPYVHTAWEASILGYQTAYMLNKSDWHSPFLRLAGVTLINDLEDEGGGEITKSFPWQQSSLQEKMKFLSKKLFNMAAVAVSTSLSVGVFFLQFLDWWYANDSNASSLTSLPVPDPPELENKESKQPQGVCPVCHKTRSNDTALAVSGYVFCYPCIYDYVQEYRCCPVTRYPATTEQLIKLYLTDS